jgi:hypothetical protein
MSISRVPGMSASLVESLLIDSLSIVDLCKRIALISRAVNVEKVLTALE